MRCLAGSVGWFGRTVVGRAASQDGRWFRPDLPGTLEARRWIGRRARFAGAAPANVVSVRRRSFSPGIQTPHCSRSKNVDRPGRGIGQGTERGCEAIAVKATHALHVTSLATALPATARSRCFLPQTCMSLRRSNHGAAAQGRVCLPWESDCLIKETTAAAVPPDFASQRTLRFAAKLKSQTGRACDGSNRSCLSQNNKHSISHVVSYTELSVTRRRLSAAWGQSSRRQLLAERTGGSYWGYPGLSARSNTGSAQSALTSSSARAWTSCQSPTSGAAWRVSHRRQHAPCRVNSCAAVIHQSHTDSKYGSAEAKRAAGSACTGTQSAIRWIMKDHDLLAPPTASTSPLVVRHTIKVPAVWQDSLHKPDWGRRPDQSASEERSAVPDNTLLLRR